MKIFKIILIIIPILQITNYEKEADKIIYIINKKR